MLLTYPSDEWAVKGRWCYWQTLAGHLAGW